MRKIVVAITGASGSLYASILIEKLLTIHSQWETVSIVMSKNARTVWETELGNQAYKGLPLDVYETDDFNAPFASGSARYDTMIIIPCSMGTLGKIAAGVSSDLITRAADVILKERRKLICVIRDNPYNLIHITKYGNDYPGRWNYLPCHHLHFIVNQQLSKKSLLQSLTGSLTLLDSI